MSTASDFTAIQNYLAVAATAAATAEKQVAAGTPSEWASVAAMFAIANAQKAAAALGIDIAPPAAPPLVLVAPATVSAVQGTAITPITLNATGGTPTYTFTATGLPVGLTLSGNTISGTPTVVAAQHSVAIAVTDKGSPAQSQSGSFLITIAAPLPPPPATIPPLGFYTGSNSAAGSKALAKTLGVTAQGCSIYCDGTSYASIGGSGWAKGLANPLPMFLGVNLVPNGGDLTQVVANLGQYATLAKAFTAGDIARIGWEPDGNWFAWGYGKGGSTPPANTIPLYIAGYRGVALEMRAANPVIRFDWCTNAGSSTLAQLQAAYPGDDVVDYIGFDHYDAGTLAANVAAVTPGIEMAAAHNKPLSIGEWGASANDDSAFIDFMAMLILHPAVFSQTYGLPTYAVGYTSLFTDSSNNISNKTDMIAEFPKVFAGE